MPDTSVAEPQASKAVRYGALGYPRFLRDAYTAVRMSRHEGLRATLAHARRIALLRAHAAFLDRRVSAGLPRGPGKRTLLHGLTIRSTSAHELACATAYSPAPSKVFQWSLAGLEIDPKRYHLVDLGSGRGFAVLLAAALPFRSVTGVEFAEQLHEDAVANLDWARQHGSLEASEVSLLHESVLEYPIANEPSIFLLYNPFQGAVMDSFLDRLVQSLRSSPRPHRLLYLHPKEHRMFQAKGFVELPLRRRERVLLRLFSPFGVKAYHLPG